jgi:DNA-binding MarR family transcriptional regulator
VEGNASEADLDPHVQFALATWPEIDPEVEMVICRILEAGRYLDEVARVGLRRVGLTKEEFKVLLELRAEARSHGALCRALRVSSGAMTNRLDKLERLDLIRRSRDPEDRRGILLSLTSRGSAKLEAYVQAGAERESGLLAALTPTEKRRLNQLLRKLLGTLRTDLGDSLPVDTRKGER